jgi:hypothetical protein
MFHGFKGALPWDRHRRIVASGASPHRPSQTERYTAAAISANTERAYTNIPRDHDKIKRAGQR